jgi:CHAT domain-containing protein
MRDLPGTATEAVALSSSLPDATTLMNQKATTKAVLSALPDSTWAHFACHASADYAAPSNSGICLSDGTLTIPRISECRLEEAEVAYLSACSTAHRNWDQIDESVNLSSVFHLAGFRHVIASLWPLDDNFAAMASQAFYREVGQGPQAADAAFSLRRATLELREQNRDLPALWASLIHSGP